MNPNELTDEQKAKLRSCKDTAELQSMLSEMGIELTDEQLDSVAGGDKWDQCSKLRCIDLGPL